MKLFCKPLRFIIRYNDPPFVKPSPLVFLFIPALLIASTDNENIRTFGVTVKGVSPSKKVYLFNNDGTNELPTEGKIILLKKDSETEMGLRVIKTYPDHKKFAAQQLNNYGNRRNLIKGGSYKAIEKVTNIAPPSTTTNQNETVSLPEPPPPPPAPPTAELSDLDENIPPSPPDDSVKDQPESTAHTESDDDAIAESRIGLAVEEVHYLSHFLNAASRISLKSVQQSEFA